MRKRKPFGPELATPKAELGLAPPKGPGGFFAQAVLKPTFPGQFDSACMPMHNRDELARGTRLALCN